MSGPSVEFVALVKNALEHLYDPAHLEGHPLGQMLLPDKLPRELSAEQALRQVLLDNIDRLKPTHSPPVGSHQQRVHQILDLRYVEALPYRDVMEELTLSQAQYHRDQRHALEAVSTLLWNVAEDLRRKGSAPEPSSSEPPPPPTKGEPVASTEGSPLDLNEVVRGVVAMLHKIALNGNVILREALPARPPRIHGDRTTIRQLIISLVGYILDGARGGQLVLSSGETADGVTFTATYEGDLFAEGFQATEASERLAVAAQLLELLGGTRSIEEGPRGISVSVSLPLRCRTLLVVEDNPDTVQLIGRFIGNGVVAGSKWTVLSAGNVREGLSLARSAKPDVVLLDIMIPEQDGWDALQMLKNDPLTQHIPVVVCTVLGESRLALALGAAEFIRKPLTRPGLLDLLARLGHAAPPQATGSPGPPAPSGVTG